MGLLVAREALIPKMYVRRSVVMALTRATTNAMTETISMEMDVTQTVQLK